MEAPSQKKRALVILIKEILDQLDEVVILKSNGAQANISMLLLQEMCSVLKELDPALLEIYFDVLPTLASATPPNSVKSFTEERAILSEPVKRRMVEKIRDQLLESAA